MCDMVESDHNVSPSLQAIDEENLGRSMFEPPLYKQRYHAVADVLKDCAVSSVLDVGCAECNLLRLLKYSSSIQRLAGLDVYLPDLEMNRGAIKPVLGDFLFKREQPLNTKLLHGSIVDYDSRLREYEAVTMVEVIEHLELDTLDLLPLVLFGRVRPKLVIITTPNAEFNVLFPDFKGFRHADHKFEWTRAEFQKWCHKVCRDHNYTVEFSGVGDPPEDRKEDVGHCSQMAVFKRVNNMQRVIVNEQDEILTYKVIAEYDFPHEDHTLSAEDHLMYEIQYNLHTLARDMYNNSGETELEVPIQNLLNCKTIKTRCDSKESIKPVLKKLGLTLNETADAVLYEIDDRRYSHSESETDNNSNCDTETSHEIDQGYISLHNQSRAKDDINMTGYDAEGEEEWTCNKEDSTAAENYSEESWD